MRRSWAGAAVLAASLVVPLVGAAGPAAPTPAVAPTHSPTHSPATVRPGTFVLGGDVARPTTISLRDLRARPATTLEVTYTSGGVPERRTFTGVPLVDLLTEAGPLTDPGVRNDLLRFAVRATATDGYEAVVAWGEIDPGFAGTQVLVATRQDGRVLSRPRLVVPSDVRGGRYVTDVVAITLLDLGST